MGSGTWQHCLMCNTYFCPEDLLLLCIFHWGMHISSPFVCCISQLNSPVKSLCCFAWKDKGILWQEILIQIIRCIFLPSFSIMSDSFFFVLMGSFRSTFWWKTTMWREKCCYKNPTAIVALVSWTWFSPFHFDPVSIGHCCICILTNFYPVFTLCKWIAVAMNALHK